MWRKKVPFISKVDINKEEILLYPDHMQSSTGLVPELETF